MRHRAPFDGCSQHTIDYYTRGGHTRCSVGPTLSDARCEFRSNFGGGHDCCCASAPIIHRLDTPTQMWPRPSSRIALQSPLETSRRPDISSCFAARGVRRVSSNCLRLPTRIPASGRNWHGAADRNGYHVRSIPRMRPRMSTGDINEKPRTVPFSSADPVSKLFSIRAFRNGGQPQRQPRRRA